MTQRKLVVAWLDSWRDGWNRFWFSPRSPATLSLMRILVGMMIVYTHAAWTLELNTFVSPQGVFDIQHASEFYGGSPFAWSHVTWFPGSAAWLWGTHALALVVMTGFMLGFQTRVCGILSALFVISYAHRAGGALFGLDQINGFLTLYLALGPCGAMYSIDAWRRRRQNPIDAAESRPASTVMATISTRLIQLHLCIVYLFAGLGKLQGPAWWDGTAIWGALASYEYQTIDLTFMASWPWLINLITLVTLAWECSYPFLIWPRLTRPIWLLLAVAVHLGIGLCMGMMTFGLIMVIANLSFVEPWLVEHLAGRLARRRKST